MEVSQNGGTPTPPRFFRGIFHEININQPSLGDPGTITPAAQVGGSHAGLATRRQQALVVSWKFAARGEYLQRLRRGDVQ